MFNNVMVAFDGSELSEKALKMGEEIALQNDARLHVFHTNVISASLAFQAQSIEPLQELLEHSGKQRREQAENLLADSKANYQIVVINGSSPEKEINKYIRKNEIDLLVIGSRGVGTIKQYFGSVAHAVLNTARIPILLIKPSD